MQPILPLLRGSFLIALIRAPTVAFFQIIQLSKQSILAAIFFGQFFHLADTSSSWPLKGIQCLDILAKKCAAIKKPWGQLPLKALDLIGLDLDGLAVFFSSWSHTHRQFPARPHSRHNRPHTHRPAWSRPVLHQHFIDIVFVEKGHLGKIIRKLLGNFGNQLFGVNVPAEFHQIVGNGLLPLGIGIVHLVGMADKLRVGR